MQVAFFPEKYPDVKVDGSDPFSEACDLLVYAVPEDAFETGPAPLTQDSTLASQVVHKRLGVSASLTLHPHQLLRLLRLPCLVLLACTITYDMVGWNSTLR